MSLEEILVRFANVLLWPLKQIIMHPCEALWVATPIFVVIAVMYGTVIGALLGMYDGGGNLLKGGTTASDIYEWLMEKIFFPATLSGWKICIPLGLTALATIIVALDSLN